MAYVSQELKAKLVPNIKAICKKYNVKASLAVRSHMTLVLNIKQGDIDFIGNFNETVNNGNPIAQVAMTVNPYWYRDHFTGRARDFLSEVIPAMNNGNHDNSDIQSDYFDVGWYIDVNIGQWNKPYALVK
jgi:hypothetical protein